MYFVTFWCGKCQTGSVVTVQSQFECGTIKIKFLVFCLKGVIPLKNKYFGKYSPCTRCTCTEGIEI
jgi:hypothetical protein